MTASVVGDAVRRNRSLAAINIPGVQIPHCAAP